MQSCANTAKFLATRVGRAEVGFEEDNEETFEQLHTRLNTTISILDNLSPTSMGGDDTQDYNRQILMPSKMGTFTFTAQDYVYKYAIPNFHFHLCSAYCILRTFGVPVNAFDYLDSDRNLFVKVDAPPPPSS